MNILIDEEFRAQLLPLSEDERAQLERSIQDDGCRDALVVWKSPAGAVLLDGHNRYEICTRLGISFDATELELPDRAAAEDWIDRNQLGRRNLTPDGFKLLIGRIYNRRKKAQGTNNQYVQAKSENPQSEVFQSGSTSAQVADEFNTSRATVERAGKAVSEIEGTALVSEVASGRVRLNEAAELAAAMRQAQPDNNEYTVDEARKVRNHLTMGTGKNEWYTPAPIIEDVRRVMGTIDIDPASNDQANETVQAVTYYTEEDDGLMHGWLGNVWLNPPYSRDLMPKFVEKLIDEYRAGNVSQAIMVSHNNTETRWFQSVAAVSAAICFPAKRIQFYEGDNVASPVNGQAFFYLGQNRQKFIDVFSEYGLIVEPYHVV